MAMNLRLERRIQASLEMFNELSDKMTGLIDDLKKAKDDAIPASVKRRLRTIERQYESQMKAERQKMDDLAESIRTDTISYGKSIKNAGWHAVYAAGRITWNTVALEGYAVAHPEVLEFQRDSGPYVAIRKDQAKS